MDGQRILLVSAAMGAGHDQSAYGLSARFRARGAQTLVVDLTELLPAGVGRLLRACYGGTVRRAPWLYNVIYRVFMARGAPGAARRTRPLARLGARSLTPVVRGFRPTAIVSTFHAGGQAVGEMRAKGLLSAATPTIVVITEMVAHSLWLSARADLYCCLTENIADAVRAATGTEAIAPGPVVDPRVGAGAKAPDRERGTAVALVSAGAWGAGDVRATAAALADVPGIRPVVLCGRNESLRRRVSATPGAEALGWRDDVPDLLARAAVAVDNAGGSMCMEALATGTPVVEYRPLPGHGEPVARALAAEGLVTRARDADGLARAVTDLSRPGPRRDAQIRRGRGLLREDPAAAIARWLDTRSAESD